MRYIDIVISATTLFLEVITLTCDTYYLLYIHYVHSKPEPFQVEEPKRPWSLRHVALGLASAAVVQSQALRLEWSLGGYHMRGLRGVIG